MRKLLYGILWTIAYDFYTYMESKRHGGEFR